MDTIVGNGAHRYRVLWDWARVPAFIDLKPAAVAVDAYDRVYAFNRNVTAPIVIFDRGGNFLGTWSDDRFVFPHAIRFDARDRVWLTDEHLGQFFQFTSDGRLLRTIGRKGVRSDTGVPPDDVASTAWTRVKQAAGPFNLPTDIVEAPDGCLFMADGYGNARVHKFSPQGEHMFSWGERGTGPGEFNLPHGLWIDRRGRLLVADRENNRVQVFDQEGKLLDIWKTELIGPAFFYVDKDDFVYIPEHNNGMISILTLDGERVARWGDPIHKSCHGVWGDSHGDFYVVMPGEWGRIRRVVKFERLKGS